MSDISILIPTLNEEERIGGLLKHLISLPHREIIVCDGGSSDATLEICAKYPVQIVQSEPGRGRQLNSGAEIAAGEILLFLHADSWIEKIILDSIQQAVAQGHDWGCCTMVFDKNTFFYKMVAFMSNLRSRWTSSCYGDQGIYCRRDVLRNRGGFPQWTFLEDVEFSRKMRRGSRAYIIPAQIITSARRFEIHGAWHTVFKMQIIKILFWLGWDPEQLARWYHTDQEVNHADSSDYYEQSPTPG